MVVVGCNSSRIILILIVKVNATGPFNIKGSKISYKIGLVVIILVGASASVEGVSKSCYKIED